MSSHKILEEPLAKESDASSDVQADLQNDLLNAEEQLAKLKASHKIGFEKHAHILSIIFMYIIISLFTIFMLWLIGYTIVASFSERFSTDAKWYSISLAFLSGALGAGFGDSIFRRVKKHWDE